MAQREPGTADWMMPPEQAELPAPAPLLRAPGFLAGMETYKAFEDPIPEYSYWQNVDKEQREREQLAKKNAAVWPGSGATGNDAPMMGTRAEEAKRIARDKQVFGTIKDVLTPGTPADVLAMMVPGGAPAKIALGLAGALHSTPAEAGISAAAAKAARKARAQRMGGVAEQAEYGALENLPSRGSNLPPGMAMLPDETVSQAGAQQLLNVPAQKPMTAKELEKFWMEGLPKPQPAARSTEIPNIREMSVQDAIDLARTQPHLIKAGEQSAGYFVGGPQTVGSKAGLNRQRREFDEMVHSDPRGGDWYDRYRAGQASTTGNDPVQNAWQAAQHGQFSAGVDPSAEQHFVLKENNSAIAGMPVKAARPAQHEAHQRAIANKDWREMQLGDKTGEYAKKVNPDQGEPNATGVDDFRYGWVQGYRSPTGGVLDAAFTPAQHKFMDYETALAVDRANKANLGGRSNWTGEQIQAVPWVIDKANDLMSRNSKLTREEAMVRAMKTVVDFYPRHIYNATHEPQPGAATGHLAGSVNAPQAVRDRYALDPASTWASAPGGRDAIYSGLGIEGTGVNMRVLPSQPMRGLYTNQAGKTESNLGEVAQPLGTFDTPQKEYAPEFVGPREYEPFKRATRHDTAIMNAGEAVRGLIDAQEASAWHKLWLGGPNKQMGALSFPRSGPASEAELLAMSKVGEKHGLPFTSDTGKGVTMFGGPEVPTKAFEKELRRKGSDFAQFGEPTRARADSGYIPRDWSQEGSGTATRQMLEYVNATPELRAAFNNNQYIAERATARLERDKEWAAQWGAPRADIQRLREIIGAGTTGWVDRVEAALKRGELLPATVGALFSGALGASQFEKGRRADAPL